MHTLDTADHKCYEGCAADSHEFKAKGLTTAGACPADYNTIDKNIGQIEQCDDGITSLRWCPENHKVKVQQYIKGQGGAPAMVSSTGTIFQRYSNTIVGGHCQDVTVDTSIPFAKTWLDANMYRFTLPSSRGAPWSVGTCDQSVFPVKELSWIPVGIDNGVEWRKFGHGRSQ
jgi:hypothetical protein